MGEAYTLSFACKNISVILQPPDEWKSLLIPCFHLFAQYFIMASSRRRMKLGTISDRWSVNCLLFIFFFNAFLVLCCSARDTITIESPMAYGKTLVSSKEKFELGFFTPGTSHGRKYIGIWYRWDPKTVVWVANRDKPLVNYTGAAVLAIENGNLNVLDGARTSYWSTDLVSSMYTNITAELLDSGNLVLSEIKVGTNKKILWQSFDHPTDTFLPGMKMVKSRDLVSWEDSDDPTYGNFTFKMDEEENRYVIQKKFVLYWKSKMFFPPDDQRFLKIDYLLSNLTQNMTGTYTPRDNRLVMNITGDIQYWSWDDESGWTLKWKEPRDDCSVFNACGKSGICNLNNDPKCTCLSGFRPDSIKNWKDGDFSAGCTAESMSCENSRFWNYTMVRVGKRDSQSKAENEAVCRNDCYTDCQCKAYSYDAAETTKRRDISGICWIWTDYLYNLQEEYYSGGRNLSVRVPMSDKVGGPGNLEPKSNADLRRTNQLIQIVLITVISVSVLSCAAIVYIWRKYVRKREDAAVRKNPVVHRFDSERHAKDLIETSEFNEEDKKGIDVPFFEFESILVATDNFSNANKLGQGGYGPVYKGKFPGGQEMAVKRLSSVSGQGLQEFKNEVVLIAKLQHRNLVKLWGYCVKGDEKLLIYEYMPNRSLDAFIFDSKLAASLDWEMRFNIVLGIARGLVYLHQDSRLRIIHRDMKTSNILLDSEMNPKISDFGLARIFGGKQNKANTNRVVGTYGYMAPEYALDGFFSVKSDVFSFGVVMLEIISGKRNTGFYRSHDKLSLLGYAWRFWEEGALELMDQTLVESCNRSECMKCVHIGLLCVQEEADDRPDMATVIVMLGSESATLPSPKQPAFIARAGPSSSGIASSSTGSKTETWSDLTNTFVEGR